MHIATVDMLSEMLRDHRHRQNRSQTRVAEDIGIKQATVSALENRPGKSKVETLFKVLSALNLELHICEKKTDADEDWKHPW